MFLESPYVEASFIDGDECAAEDRLTCGIDKALAMHKQPRNISAAHAKFLLFWAHYKTPYALSVRHLGHSARIRSLYNLT